MIGPSLYHVESAGGGHAPDLIRCVSYDNVIPGTTNPPTRTRWVVSTGVCR
ncbi:hypothetical protein [Mycolicibacterium goodii]|uniref:hypothetical protein n=1 Tax=Mycolicibacterium goodii TaxID=134601 RepID=UPI000A573C36